VEKKPISLTFDVICDFISHYGCDYYGNVGDGLLALDREYAKGFLFTRLFKQSLEDGWKLRMNENFFYQEDLEFCFRYMTKCKNMAASSEAGYYYFVPDGLKYVNIHYSYNLFRSLYLSSKEIFGNSWTSVTAYSLDRFTRDLLDSYKKQDTDRKEKLHVYRNTVGRDVLRTKLFCPTRVLIFADATLCLSNANLNLHTRLKAWV